MTTRVVTDVESVRALLKTFNELPPKVKTGVRRELRKTGDDIIAGQRAALDGPLPAAVGVAGQRFGAAYNPKTGQHFIRKYNVYEDRAVQRAGRGTGLREGIKAGLATRVVTGTTRQGISITNNGRKTDMATGWNAKRFRHPVFGNREKWVYQGGQPYMFEPIFEGRAALIEQAITILNNAMEGK
jgi:hypothetical protein